MSAIIVGLLGTQNINGSETDSVSFLGAGTLNIAGVPTAPIGVTLSNIAGLGLLDTVNISNAFVVVGDLVGVSALVSYNIGTNGILVFPGAAALAVGTTANFSAPAGTFGQIDLGTGADLPLISGFTNFNLGKTIDIPFAVSQVSFAANYGSNNGGVLTLQNALGGALGTLTFANGNYSNTSFTLGADGFGGTLLSVGPVVTGVTATAGNFTDGQTIRIKVATSEAVNVAGAPTLMLNDGGTATYNAAASTSTSLDFDYTVTGVQDAPTLAVTGVSFAGGASVTDSVGNAGNLAGAAVAIPGVQVDTSTTAGATAGLNQIYQDLNQRLPSAGELGLLRSDLQAGYTLAQIRAVDATSEEVQALSAQTFASVLDRAPSAGEIAFDTQGLANGTLTQTQLRAILVSSGEAQVNLQLISQDVLGRTATTAELNAETAQLTAGTSLAYIRTQVALGAEAQSDIAQISQATLGRAPTPAENFADTVQLASGLNQQAITFQSLVLGSNPNFISDTPSNGVEQGTAGSDVFSFGNAPSDTVVGFDPTHDLLEFSRSQVFDVEAFLSQSKQTQAGTLITLDATHSVLLQGVAPSSIFQADVKFV